MLFSRAWVKVMSLIKEIDEILTCSNIDYYGHNDDDDNSNILLHLMMLLMIGVCQVKGQGKIKAYGIVKRLISLLFILADRNAMVTRSSNENLLA